MFLLISTATYLFNPDKKCFLCLKNLFQADEEIFCRCHWALKLDDEPQGPSFHMYTAAFDKNRQSTPWHFLLWSLVNVSHITTIHN